MFEVAAGSLFEVAAGWFDNSRKRIEAELRKEKEAQTAKAARREKALQALRNRNICPRGFEFHSEGDGWRCNGGSHYISNLSFIAFSPI